jgi:hypothetical protein
MFDGFGGVALLITDPAEHVKGFGVDVAIKELACLSSDGFEREIIDHMRFVFEKVS